MTDAVSGAGEDRKGRTTGDPGAHSPIVTPTETEAPGGRGPVTGRAAGVPRGADEEHGEAGSHGQRRESVPVGTPAGGRGGGSGSGATSGHGARLLPHDECDKLSTRLRHAVAGFVDEPRSAVEEADHVLEEAAARFTDAVKQRRRTLRNSWQAGDSGQDEAVGVGDTEQLRLALRDYRELTERLLHS